MIAISTLNVLKEESGFINGKPKIIYTPPKPKTIAKISFLPIFSEIKNDANKVVNIGNRY